MLNLKSVVVFDFVRSFLSGGLRVAASNCGRTTEWVMSFWGEDTIDRNCVAVRTTMNNDHI